MIKKLFAIAAIFILLICGNSFAQKKIKVKEYRGPLIGKWETPNLEMNTSHLTMQFEPKYKFSYDLKSIWNGNYKFEGTRLASSYYIPFMNKWVKDTSTVLINTDTLVIESNKDTTHTAYKFFRIKDTLNTNVGIYGKWESKNYMGNSAIFNFNKDGSMSIQKTLNKYNGYFTVQKNIFSVFAHRQMVMELKFQIIRDELYLYKIGNSDVLKLVRVK